MSDQRIAEEIERFVRTQFRVAPGDARFSRSQHLFEQGYVDSVGVVELLAFLGEAFGAEVPEELLMSEDFSTIDGIAGIVARLRNGQMDPKDAPAS
jgi:acyl carrier protein